MTADSGSKSERVRAVLLALVASVIFVGFAVLLAVAFGVFLLGAILGQVLLWPVFILTLPVLFLAMDFAASAIVVAGAEGGVVRSVVHGLPAAVGVVALWDEPTTAAALLVALAAGAGAVEWRVRHLRHRDLAVAQRRVTGLMVGLVVATLALAIGGASAEEPTQARVGVGLTLVVASALWAQASADDRNADSLDV